jgi:hypothetical protein
MDDILHSHPDLDILQNLLAHVLKQLPKWGLTVAPKKVQKESPFSYLGQLIEGCTVHPPKIEICKHNLKTLNDFQKLLGDMNWLCPALKLTTYEVVKFYRETLNYQFLDMLHHRVLWPWLRLNKLFITLRELVFIIINQFNFFF